MTDSQQLRAQVKEKSRRADDEEEWTPEELVEIGRQEREDVDSDYRGAALGG